MQISESKNQEIPNGKGVKITILLPHFNEKYGLKLYENTVETLKSHGVEDLTLVRTPGALELPFTAQKIISSSNPDSKPDVIIALGIVIRGETSHYDYVCSETFRGLMDVQLRLETPIVFGILTCETGKQVQERISKTGLNKGKSFAETALIQQTK